MTVQYVSAHLPCQKRIYPPGDVSMLLCCHPKGKVQVLVGAGVSCKIKIERENISVWNVRHVSCDINFPDRSQNYQNTKGLELCWLPKVYKT